MKWIERLKQLDVLDREIQELQSRDRFWRRVNEGTGLQTVRIIHDWKVQQFNDLRFFWMEPKKVLSEIRTRHKWVDTTWADCRLPLTYHRECSVCGVPEEGCYGDYCWEPAR
jgi:hypothetical protein